MLRARRPTFTWRTQRCQSAIDGGFTILSSTLVSHPEGVSIQGSHHGHEERLLEQGEQGTDEGLHAGQAAKLGRRIPVRDKQCSSQCSIVNDSIRFLLEIPLHNAGK